MSTALARFAPILAATLLILLVPTGLSAVALTGSQCVPAGSTGLTARVVAHQYQVISGSVNAAGCDVGIYVPPGANYVVITGASVTGANDHGIFAQDVTGLLISKSIVTGNGVAPHTCHGNQTKCIADDKGVSLVGTHYAVVTNNVVTANNGGIALTDDGFVDPGAINPGSVSASVGNVVSMNYVNGTGDCGIIVAGFNPGKVVINNTVFGNMIFGNSPKSPGPYVGQIVVAADGPNATLWNTVVRANTLQGSLLPGIVVHSNAPGDIIDGTWIISNNIMNNGGYPPASFTTVNDPVNATGIAVMAEAFTGMPSPPIVSHTYIAWNVISGDTYGIWTCQTIGTTISNIWGNSGTPKTACAAGA